MDDLAPVEDIAGAAVGCLEAALAEASAQNERRSGHLKPAGATSKEFAWFCDMEHNLHAQYDAQILLGRDLADAYVRHFSSSTVPKADHDQDSAMRFPWEPCAPGESASPSHQCWDDLRPRSPQSAAAGGTSECRPVPEEAACLMMDSYTGAHLISAQPSP